MILCGICVLQTQHRKHALDLAGYADFTMPHELDRIGKDISALKSRDREVAIDHTDHLFKVCIRLVDHVSDSTN